MTTPRNDRHCEVLKIRLVPENETKSIVIIRYAWSVDLIKETPYLWKIHDEI